jgi:hypothetical protein
MSKSNLFYVFVIGILIVPAYGSDHWDFDGDIGQGWHFEGTPQWHLDCNVSHSGSCSMRSGEILPFSGPTSIWREVQGPAITSFWWKADSIQVCTDPAVMCKGLFFVVDGKTQLTCDSAYWKEARFPLADGLHRVEWIFKPRTDRKGIGWLDDVSITPSPIATYTNHSLSFEIPYGWSITRDAQSANDTQIVLSNETSTIRIDIVDLPQMTWLRNSSSNGFAINSVVLGYYQKHILEQDVGSINAWSGANKPNPDGIGQLTFGVGGEGKEWVLGWSKPEYGEKFIGVHALFNGNFAAVDLSEGRSDWRYYMPTPFYDLLDSFKTNAGTAAKEMYTNAGIVAKKMYGLPVQNRLFT